MGAQVGGIGQSIKNFAGDAFGGTRIGGAIQSRRQERRANKSLDDYIAQMGGGGAAAASHPLMNPQTLDMVRQAYGPQETMQLLSQSLLQPQEAAPVEEPPDPFANLGAVPQGHQAYLDPATNQPALRQLPGAPAETETPAYVKAGDDRYRFTEGPQAGELVFPDLEVAKEEGKKPTIENVMSLSNEWQTAAKPLLEMDRQRGIMQAGMDAARDGDIASGAQAIGVTFQKILDPISVVRESEFARTAAGQSMLDRAQGAMEKLTAGGIGVTVDDLQQFVDLADDIVQQAVGGRLQSERQRISRVADHFGIEQSLIFEDYDLFNPQTSVPTDMGDDDILSALGVQ